MAKKFSTSDLAGSTGGKRRQSKSRARKSKSIPQKQKMIILPAIEATQTISKASASNKRAERSEERRVGKEC